MTRKERVLMSDLRSAIVVARGTNRQGQIEELTDYRRRAELIKDVLDALIWAAHEDSDPQDLERAISALRADKTQ